MVCVHVLKSFYEVEGLYLPLQTHKQHRDVSAHKQLSSTHATCVLSQQEEQENVNKTMLTDP